MANSAAPVCTKCGSRIVGLVYSHEGKKICYSCHEKIVANMEQLEQEKQGVYRYISELFGVAELPADVLAGVSRELNSGKTPRGACATLRYYYAVEGNLPTNINSVPYIIRDYYEVAREYVRKTQQLKKKNAEIDIDVPSVTITLDPNKLNPKKPKMDYNIEDL